MCSDIHRVKTRHALQQVRPQLFNLTYPTRFSHSGRSFERVSQTFLPFLARENLDPHKHACKESPRRIELVERHRKDWYHYHQSFSIIANMADYSENTNKQETLSKGVAKRKYLLLDGDLDRLEFETKDNPVNKSYG